jgi:hypothetical protein
LHAYGWGIALLAIDDRLSAIRGHLHVWPCSHMQATRRSDRRPRTTYSQCKTYLAHLTVFCRACACMLCQIITQIGDSATIGNILVVAQKSNSSSSQRVIECEDSQACRCTRSGLSHCVDPVEAPAAREDAKSRKIGATDSATVSSCWTAFRLESVNSAQVP